MDTETALLPPGLHDGTLAELHALCVAPFPASRTRPAIFAGLSAFLAVLAGFGVPMELWVDGSFVTNKPDPNDVDVAVLVEQSRFDSLPPDRREKLFDLFWRREAARARWRVDAYIFPDGDRAQEAFWRNLYGYSRTGEAKGIIRLQVTP